MIGKRKFIVILVGLGIYGALLAFRPLDPLTLGVGMGMMMFPNAAANAVEHITNSKKNN